MRAYIINRQIDDIRGTLYRQTMFAEFEKVIHAVEEAGGALTLDVFKASIANYSMPILAMPLLSTPRWSSNVSEFRIFTAPFTFTNTPPDFPLPWLSPSASSTTNRTQLKIILAFLNRADRSSRSKHYRMPGSI